MRRPLGLVTLLIAGALATASAARAAEQGESRVERTFPRYASLEPNVAFWRDVFSKHDKHEIVFHDVYRLDLVYEVADVGHILQSSASEAEWERRVRAFMQSEATRISGILRQLEDGDPASDEEGAIQAAVLRTAGSVSYRELATRVRAQRGLAHELCGTIDRARPYLDDMRQVLAANGVPPELVSLPIIESSFRWEANSSAGAVGVWQFTRGTGRRFLRIDHVVDERRDVLLATEAAAKYLRENYSTLGTWPLAITAYNHGAGGMANAVRQLGTTDFGVIAEQYSGRAFGFASRNFYAEFLAAQDVLAKGLADCAEPLDLARLDHAVIDAYVPLSRLAECSGVSTGELARLNPALQPDVASGRLYVPKGYRLNLPPGSRLAFDAAYASLPSEVVYGGQRPYYASHRVRPGQTLSHIASMYHTSVAALQNHNNIGDPRSLRSGQTVRVPVAGIAPGSTPAVASRASAGSSYIAHRVRSGQTLSHIAKEYRVRVADLVEFNGIGDPRSLVAGAIVRVPASGGSTGERFRTHRVKRGQTLSHIARLYRTSVSTLQRFNGISDPDSLRHGQVIRVPM